MNQMVSYYGLVILLHYLTMDFADWNLQMLIRTGKFLTFILPKVLVVTDQHDAIAGSNAQNGQESHQRTKREYAAGKIGSDYPTHQR